MPAIQLARLRIQAAQLSNSFAEPLVFRRELHDLFEFYSDRTYRPGQAGEPPPLLRAFNVPAPVLRQLVRELAPHSARDPGAVLLLCDTLWAEPYYEFRLLAISLLGEVPSQLPDSILDRVRVWAVPSIEARLIRALFSIGLARLRRDMPDLYLKQIDTWLHSADGFSRHLGLQALISALAAQALQNLPVIFRLIAPIVRAAPFALRPDLLDVLRLLAEQSPKETAFFLRENLAIKTENPGTIWLARQSLPFFPPETQARLRAALREAK